MNDLNIKLFFKKRKQRLSVFGFSPEFDWKVIFILSFTFFVVGIIYASFLYNKIMKGSMFNVVDDSNLKNETIQKKADIDKVIKNITR